MKELIYLASPYSHASAVTRELRFMAVCWAASRLMRDGHKIFSPIAHTHPIALAGGLPTDWEFWRDYDRAILEFCAKLIVLKLPGWQESKGIAVEMAIAEGLGVPIEFLEPE